MVLAVTCVYSHVLPLRFSQDHINFIIGRQSFNLRQLEDALLAFKELLLGESLQSSEQQASYLREFLFVFQVWRFFSIYRHLCVSVLGRCLPENLSVMSLVR